MTERQDSTSSRPTVPQRLRQQTLNQRSGLPSFGAAKPSLKDLYDKIMAGATMLEIRAADGRVVAMVPDAKTDRTGAAREPFAAETIIELGDEYATKAQRAINSTSGTLTTSIMVAIIKAHMYEFMFEVLEEYDRQASS